MNDAITVIAM